MFHLEKVNNNTFNVWLHTGAQSELSGHISFDCLTESNNYNIILNDLEFFTLDQNNNEITLSLTEFLFLNYSLYYLI
jgi:hypothetical protein